VFSFAKAIEMGWPGADQARELVDQGLDYLNGKLRHPDGGWVHTVARDGTPVDDRRDLYDHAFIILAGATAYRITGSEMALQVADDAIAFIDAELKDHKHGGWFEGLPATLPRRANPHMHLLEAMLAYHEATRCSAALARAAECVRLFETRFFDPATDVMAEKFTDDWRPQTGNVELRFEPGHHYEWATLLLDFERVSSRDTLSWRRRLIQRADQSGRNISSGLAMNTATANDEPYIDDSRLWHQLEMLRAHLSHPSSGQPQSPIFLLEAIVEQYLLKGPEGGWLDEISSDGTPKSTAVPASMLYHMITALESLSRGRH
jgi:mannose/cellobiose epimerase-like protein (N-acyl-D-glucosamine 2-epimerase family)